MRMWAHLLALLFALSVGMGGCKDDGSDTPVQESGSESEEAEGPPDPGEPPV